MYCPVCGYKSTRVVDSRVSQDHMSVRRRRECERPRCAFRFSTMEEAEVLDVTIVKRNGARQAYSREKLINGLKKALEKRSFTDQEFKILVQKIERDIQKRRSGEITSLELGEIVMKQLRTFDKVAYIRFASVYHSFEGLEKFEEELSKLIRKRRTR